MYSNDKSLYFKSSVSSISNNLSVIRNDIKDVVIFASIHKSVVHILSYTNHIVVDGSGIIHRQVICKEPLNTNHGNTFILQARLLQMAQRLLLVIACQKGIQIYEADGSLMVYWYSFSNQEDDEESGNIAFARGICGISDNVLCVGKQDGVILVFEIPVRGTNVILLETLKGSFDAPICDIQADDEILVSSDDFGNITIWDIDKCSGAIRYQPNLCIDGEGFPCNSLKLWRKILIAGYSSGHIRLFDTSTGYIKVEVTAHARLISSIDISKSGRVLSTSEDSYVSVWQLEDPTSPEIKHLFTQQIKDSLIQGGQFTDEDGDAFCVTCYDTNELFRFKKS